MITASFSMLGIASSNFQIICIVGCDPPASYAATMLSEFGQPFDVELTGHGTVGLDWEEWRNCFNLAKAFGWEPAGTLAPTDQTHWGGPPAFVGEWNGGYFSKDLQRVTDVDAKALSAALQIAMLAWDRIEELTIREFDALRRVPRSYESYLTRVADYAARRGFLIF